MDRENRRYEDNNGLHAGAETATDLKRRVDGHLGSEERACPFDYASIGHRYIVPDAARPRTRS